MLTIALVQYDVGGIVVIDGFGVGGAVGVVVAGQEGMAVRDGGLGESAIGKEKSEKAP